MNPQPQLAPPAPSHDVLSVIRRLVATDTPATRIEPAAPLARADNDRLLLRADAGGVSGQAGTDLQATGAPVPDAPAQQARPAAPQGLRRLCLVVGRRGGRAVDPAPLDAAENGLALDITGPAQQPLRQDDAPDPDLAAPDEKTGTPGQAPPAVLADDAPQHPIAAMPCDVPAAAAPDVCANWTAVGRGRVRPALSEGNTPVETNIETENETDTNTLVDRITRALVAVPDLCAPANTDQVPARMDPVPRPVFSDDSALRRLIRDVVREELASLDRASIPA